ncbi:hypothetical protein [Parenemella sanctibonifatiensis]|uniref:DUF7973 domain-containing protein n=1 Tax=Parenemella sanctibonifatiensis TaxID=2016505 RepID=A0A255DZ67_9ACTN|nr:hypothetical protein [Parenemella sanctibonifatiensis]OYN84536.1 hypothetical protein CGZ92_11880 [Parenemella sanctibonifatiensis]
MDFFSSVPLLVFGILAAAAGGWFGAAIGGNFSFGIAGVAVMVSWGILAATGDTVGFDYIAFGPFTGPHVGFAGGVAAAAYAYKRGYIDSGRDVVLPLASLGKPDVLLVGAGFGAGGFLVQQGIAQIPWFGSNTDAVALTVVLSALVARLLVGGGMVHSERKENGWAPSEKWRWLEWQEKPSQYLSIAFFVGILAAAVSIVLGHAFEGAAANAHTFTFGISAICIIFLSLGANMPVTHHMTIIGGLAAAKFMPILAGEGFSWTGEWGSGEWTAALIAVLIGAVFAMISATIAELGARWVHNRGDTHIDPPAFAIWPSTTLVLGIVAFL